MGRIGFLFDRYIYIATQIRRSWRSGSWIISPIFMSVSQVCLLPSLLRTHTTHLLRYARTNPGVITYSTNLNTAALVRQLTSQDPNPRLILETDAPYMIPSHLYGSLKGVKGRLPLSHTAMIPWTAEFVAGVANGVGVEGKEEGTEWDTDRVLKLCRENAKKMYGV